MVGGTGSPPPENRRGISSAQSQPGQLTPEFGLLRFSAIQHEITEVNAGDPNLMKVDIAIAMALGSQLVPEERRQRWLRDAPSEVVNAVDGLPYPVLYAIMLDELIRRQENPDDSTWGQAHIALFAHGTKKAEDRGVIRPDADIGNGDLDIQALAYARAANAALGTYIDPHSQIKEKGMFQIMVRFGQVVEDVAYDLYLERRENYYARLVLDAKNKPAQGLMAMSAEFVRRQDRELEALVPPS